MQIQIKSKFIFISLFLLISCGSHDKLKIIYRSTYVEEFSVKRLVYSGNDLEHSFIFMGDKCIVVRMGLPEGLFDFRVNGDTIHIKDHFKNRVLIINHFKPDSLYISDFQYGLSPTSLTSFGKYYIDKKSTKIADILNFDILVPELFEYYKDIKIR